MEKIAGFYFCHCPDVQLAKEYMEEYISSFGNEWIKAERHTFWVDDLLSNKFFIALDEVSFEIKKKIFFIRDTHELNAEIWKRLSLALGKPREDVFPIFFINNTLDKGKLKLPVLIQKQKCFEFAKKQKWYFESIGITEKNFAQILLKEAKQKYDLSLSNDIIHILQNTLSPDYNSINNVLAQLYLFSENGEININVVAQLTNYTPELGLFDIVKKIETGKAKEVWSFFIKEGRIVEDSYLFAFIAIMAREMRLLWKIKANEPTFLNNQILNYKTKIAQQLGFTYISKIISLLTFAEFSVKSGKKDPLETFEELLKDITNIYNKNLMELALLYSVKTSE